MKKNKMMNNYYTPEQIKELNANDMFSREVDDATHTITVAPVFETYKCFDISYTSRKMATLAKDYVKAFFANKAIFDNKPYWKWTEAMDKISDATVELVEALGNAVINGGNFAKAVLIVQQLLHRNPVMVAKGQLKAIGNFSCVVPHHNDLYATITACKNLVKVCETYPEDAYKFFD